MRKIIDEGDIMLMDRPSDHGTPVACIQPRAADPARTPTTVRVSDPASCLRRRSAGLTSAPRATGTPSSHFSMTIQLYSPCLRAFMLDCYCWALGAGLLMVSMVTFWLVMPPFHISNLHLQVRIPTTIPHMCE